MRRHSLARALPAAAAGLAVILNGLLLRVLMHADRETVYVFGIPLHWVCALKRRTGLPCPTCGMTRGVLLSLQGDFASAWRLAPGAPVLVIGASLFAAAMLMLAAVQYLGGTRLEAAMRTGIRRSIWVYAAAAAVFWLGGWVVALEHALRGLRA